MMRRAVGRPRRRFAATLAAVAVAAGLAAASAPGANAGGSSQNTVTTCDQESLVNAVQSAGSNGGTVEIVCSGTITLQQQIEIPSGDVISIDAAQAPSPGVTLSGGSSTRIFAVDENASLTLSHLTLENGQVFGTDGTPGAPGSSGTPGNPGQNGNNNTGSGTPVSNGLPGGGASNDATVGGDGADAGDADGGAITAAAGSTVTVTNSTLSSNSVAGGSGGVGGSGGDGGSGGGGGIGGTCQTYYCAEAGGNGGDGGGGGDGADGGKGGKGGDGEGGAIYSAGSVIATDDTFTDNSAFGGYGGDGGVGGAAGPGGGGGQGGPGALGTNGGNAGNAGPNGAPGNGGDGGDAGDGDGGAIYSSGSIYLSEDTFTNNVAVGNVPGTGGLGGQLAVATGGAAGGLAGYAPTGAGNAGPSGGNGGAAGAGPAGGNGGTGGDGGNGTGGALYLEQGGTLIDPSFVDNGTWGSPGGNGGAGADGTDGGIGGPGAPGAVGAAGVAGGNGGNGGNGGDGGMGGDGGDPGDGGNGGNGGDADAGAMFAGANVCDTGQTYSNDSSNWQGGGGGGAAGTAGEGGAGGGAGQGAPGGACNGAGTAGQPGTDGTPGTDGNDGTDDRSDGDVGAAGSAINTDTDLQGGETSCPDTRTPLEINTNSLPDGAVGQPYRAQISVTGGEPPFDLHVSEGTLPAGLSMDDAGLISGTPTEDGDFPVTVDVTDSSYPVLEVTEPYRLEVSKSVPSPPPTTPSTTPPPTTITPTPPPVVGKPIRRKPGPPAHPKRRLLTKVQKQNYENAYRAWFRQEDQELAILHGSDELVQCLDVFKEYVLDHLEELKKLKKNPKGGLTQEESWKIVRRIFNTEVGNAFDRYLEGVNAPPRIKAFGKEIFVGLKAFVLKELEKGVPPWDALYDLGSFGAHQYFNTQIDAHFETLKKINDEIAEIRKDPPDPAINSIALAALVSGVAQNRCDSPSNPFCEAVGAQTAALERPDSDVRHVLAALITTEDRYSTAAAAGDGAAANLQLAAFEVYSGEIGSDARLANVAVNRLTAAYKLIGVTLSPSPTVPTGIFTRAAASLTLDQLGALLTNLSPRLPAETRIALAGELAAAQAATLTTTQAAALAQFVRDAQDSGTSAGAFLALAAPDAADPPA